MRNYISILFFLLFCYGVYAQCALDEIGSTTTPCGARVNNDSPYGWDYTAAGAFSVRNQVANMYPCAAFLDDATTVYNCFAYAFHMSNNNFQNEEALWVNNPAPYFNGGCYSSTGLATGTKARYFLGGITHAACVWPNTFTFRSKWGAWPLLRHSRLCVPPSYGTTVNYVRRTGFTGAGVSKNVDESNEMLNLNWEINQDQEGIAGFNIIYLEGEGNDAMGRNLNASMIKANSFEFIQQNGDRYTYELNDAALNISNIYLETVFQDGSTEILPFKG